MYLILNAAVLAFILDSLNLLVSVWTPLLKNLTQSTLQCEKAAAPKVCFGIFSCLMFIYPFPLLSTHLCQPFFPFYTHNLWLNLFSPTLFFLLFNCWHTLWKDGQGRGKREMKMQWRKCKSNRGRKTRAGIHTVLQKVNHEWCTKLHTQFEQSVALMLYLIPLFCS